MSTPKTKPARVATPAGSKTAADAVGTEFNTPFPPEGQFLLSVFTSDSTLSKSFFLDSAGNMQKRNGGKMGLGRLRTVAFKNADALAGIISKLTPNQAVAYGYAFEEKAFVVTKDMLADFISGEQKHPNVAVSDGKAVGGDGTPILTRTNGAFSFLERPSIMMLDYDVPKVEGEKYASEPALFGAYDFATNGELGKSPFILAYSASSLIYNGAELLKGVSGVRILVLVKDGSDIQRAGKVLFDRLVLAGLGYAEVYKNGTVAIKTLVDRAVWTPEHLDFLAGAHCEPPLEQRRPEPKVFNNNAEPMDTRKALPDLTLQERAKLSAIVEALKKGVEAESRQRKREWSEEMARKRLEKFGIDADKDLIEFDKAKKLYMQATDSLILMGDYELLASDGQTVTVGELLDNPKQWHGKRFHDPLEPEYGGNDSRICYANLITKGKPSLWSHAHGGRRFNLTRALATIQVRPGERAAIVDRVLELFRLQEDVFARGGELVKVGGDGVIQPLPRDSVQFELDCRARWEKWSQKDKDYIPADAPKAVAEGVIAAKSVWGLPKLEAVVHAPVYLPRTGRVVQEEGHDAETGLLLVQPRLDLWPGVPSAPTLEQARGAVAALWRPFELFPYCEPSDRGVLLAAILTAVCRAALPTAPAFAMTAPCAGSGKSLLALALSYLARAQAPDVSPGKVADEEIRKRLLALGRKGVPVSVFDNITGAFSSDALCAWLTTSVFSDRILGVSEQAVVPTKMLMLLTGNNMTLKGDLCRRVMTCRIDPKIETPYKRAFDLNPAEYCRDNYLALVASAITLLKYYHDKPNPVADRTASFEEWSDSIRKTVILIGQDGLLDVADPTTSVDEAYRNDPETAKLRGLLHGWHAAFGSRPTPVASCIEKAQQNVYADDEGDEVRALKGVVEEIALDRGKINSRIMGRWIESMRGRIVDGLRFERHGVIRGITNWKVCKS